MAAMMEGRKLALKTLLGPPCFGSSNQKITEESYRQYNCFGGAENMSLSNDAVALCVQPHTHDKLREPSAAMPPLGDGNCDAPRSTHKKRYGMESVF